MSLLALQCSTQIIVYAENTVQFQHFSTLCKRQRFNLRVYLNKIQKAEGLLSTETQYKRGERLSKVLFLFVE